MAFVIGSIIDTTVYLNGARVNPVCQCQEGENANMTTYQAVNPAVRKASVKFKTLVDRPIINPSFYDVFFPNSLPEGVGQRFMHKSLPMLGYD